MTEITEDIKLVRGPEEEVFVLGEWILGEIIEPPEMTAGGIYIPKTDKKNPEKTKRMRIIKLGDQIERRDLQSGDIVLVHYSAGLECEKFGHLFKEANIMAIVVKKEN